MSDHKSQPSDHAELSIDRATLEAIAYRLKHVVGLYRDQKQYEAAAQCLYYADLLLGCARSSCDDTKRLDWLGEKCTGASDSERYLPFRVYWGGGSHRDIRGAIDKMMGGDDRPITDAYDHATVAQVWTDFEPPEDWRTTDENGIPVACDCPADNQREDDYEPVYATLHFYYNDPDSMRRFRLCNQAEDLKLALWEYDNWLRNKIKYSDGTSDPAFEIPRAHLHTVLADHGIDLTEE